MKCIDEELIQKYIDVEATQKEVDLIENHIEICSVCADNIEKQRALTAFLKREINHLFEDDKTINIPEFVSPAAQVKPIRRKIKKWIYSAAAACLLFVIIYIGFLKEQKQEEYVLLFEIGTEFDANQPISQQEMTITIIDINNNTVENY